MTLTESIASTDRTHRQAHERLHKRHNRQVFVTDYGAVGDGVTDDTQAFLDALAAIGTSGDTLYIPVGRYVISETLTLPVYSNMRGAGCIGAVLVGGASLSGAVIRMTKDNYVGYHTLTGFGIDGAGVASAGIEYTHINEVAARDLRIINCDAGISITGGVWRCSWHNCELRACGVGVVAVTDDGQVNSNLIDNCHIRGNTTYGVNIAGGTLNRVVACTIEGNGTAGVRMVGGAVAHSQHVPSGI